MALRALTLARQAAARRFSYQSRWCALHCCVAKRNGFRINMSFLWSSSVHAGVCIPRLLPALGDLPVSLSAGEPVSYWLTRSLFLRCLGGVFAVAFSVALRQNPALIGDEVGGECRVLQSCLERVFISPKSLTVDCS